MIMINDLIPVIIIEILILYIVLRIIYKMYLKEKQDEEFRILQLEKRISKFERKVKNK